MKCDSKHMLSHCTDTSTWFCLSPERQVTSDLAKSRDLLIGPIYLAYYMTLFNTTTFHMELWCRGMFVTSRTDDSGSRRKEHFVISVIFIATVFCIFCSLFPTMANTSISIFLPHWHSLNFLYQFSQFMRCCKECNACNNWWYLFTVLLREITQNIADRNIANVSVLLLFFEKLPG